MLRIHVHLTAELDEAVRRLSERQDRPISRVVRSAVEEYVMKYEDEGIGEYQRTIYIDPVKNPVPKKEASNG